MWQRISYRVKQFFRVLGANLRPVDDAYARQRLTIPELLALFERMSRQERNHAIDVCRKLETEGYDDPDLITAALLHDAGKLRLRITIPERVWVVLGEYAFPKAALRWGTAEHRVTLWRRGFVLRHHHADWGADMAAAGGASARTVEIIRRHHDTLNDDVLITALNQADDR